MNTILKSISSFAIIFILCNSPLAAASVNTFINSITPAMNSVSVDKTSNINIAFMQPMNPSSINNANIKVFGYQTGLLPVTIDYDAATKTANINPNHDFKAGEKISITLTEGLKTISNENINPFVFTFYVRATGGNGYFFKSSILDGFTNGTYIKSGDLDGDNDIDLVINNRIYKNNGSAAFTYSSTLSEAGRPELADWDNDGDLDILISNDINIFFYKNDGSGEFILTGTYAGGVGAFGDLDGDGYLDIAYFPNVETMRTIKNINAVFTLNPVTFTTESANAVDNILIDDLDNDGEPDILGINFSFFEFFGRFNVDRHFNELHNNGNGNFIMTSILSDHYDNLGSIVLFMKDSKSIDLNNDGYVDIVAPGKNLSNFGSGAYNVISSNFFFANSEVADFNGDGNIDVSESGFSSPIQTSINLGNGDFNRFTGIDGRFSSFSAAADFDNDGDIDLAIVEYLTPDVAILLNGDNQLPVELSSFSSLVTLRDVTLNWTTSTEENNKGFDIERSATIQWDKIGFIAGSGNSNSQRNYSFDDHNLSSGKYKYRLKQIDFNGNYKYYNLTGEVVIRTPDKFRLLQNFPNPFNPTTSISYELPSSGNVIIRVYDTKGNEVSILVNEKEEAGYYTINFDAGKLSSGAYFYKIETGTFVQTKRMVILK